jgi:hypothetical protein
MWILVGITSSCRRMIGRWPSEGSERIGESASWRMGESVHVNRHSLTREYADSPGGVQYAATIQ